MPIDMLGGVHPHIASQDLVVEMQDIQARVYRRLLQAQKAQKRQADWHRQDLEFAVRAQVLLSTHNLCLKLPKKLQDH